MSSEDERTEKPQFVFTWQSPLYKGLIGLDCPSKTAQQTTEDLGNFLYLFPDGKVQVKTFIKTGLYLKDRVLTHIVNLRFPLREDQKEGSEPDGLTFFRADDKPGNPLEVHFNSRNAQVELPDFIHTEIPNKVSHGRIRFVNRAGKSMMFETMGNRVMYVKRI